MRVVHASWSDGRLRLWGETAGRSAAQRAAGRNGDTEHPFAMDSAELRDLAARCGFETQVEEVEPIDLHLPSRGGAPTPSPPLVHAAGRIVHADDEGDPLSLARWSAPSVALEPSRAWSALDAIEDEAARSHERAAETTEADLSVSDSLRFFATAARLARSLIAEERFVPTALQEAEGGLLGAWHPWLGDAHTAERVSELLRAMPPSARAAIDGLNHEPWPVLLDFLNRVVDGACRRTLEAERMREAVEDRDPGSDPHVVWLSGLLGPEVRLPASSQQRPQIARAVRSWLSRLDDRGVSATWRLHLRLDEPLLVEDLEDFESPGDDVRWTLTFQLQSAEDENIVVDAADIWATPSESMTVHGMTIESPRELMLAELGRAARLYPLLEETLSQQEPNELNLTTDQAYEFVREIAPLLSEQGVSVTLPTWWNSSTARVGVSLEIDSEEPDETSGGSEDETSAASRLGLSSLVDYRWRIAVGGRVLNAEEFERLSRGASPLVQVGGRWVEVRPEDAKAALDLVRRDPGGQTSAAGALRLAFGAEAETQNAPVLNVSTTGWISKLFDQDAGDQRVDDVGQPEGFVGTLRAYQQRGLAWLAFLDSLGLGACLADDMGLGKTIELLALLLHEREQAARRTPDIGSKPSDWSGLLGPTLIVAPMSVISNWHREAKRFAPSLKVMVHHGPERALGKGFETEASRCDAVITTYALANRDNEHLLRTPWRRVVLDEAQNIKNPSAKQSQAIHRFGAPRRVALTGTPVENRLGELWSIMEFCNPGYLGSASEFRRRFSIPIERRHDRARSEQLRRLTRPFILRRLKSDPAVTADLPEKIETREFCNLTPEQASLYEREAERMLGQVDQTEGMQRRGVVLSALIRLKQICNHPAQALGESDSEQDGPAAASRSGKCMRLREMLEEALEAGDQALIFTQFRQMGRILAAMLRHDLDREILFLHGGVPHAERERLIERFQKGDGSAPIFILSLKAGGLGMNLTAASHVFHFDRWWNPAVENQATDRAHRIGQTRNVQVHKFVVAGTLEERIDQMLEQKSDLADRIIGSGERWLTELSTSQLRDLLTLRRDAVRED